MSSRMEVSAVEPRTVDEAKHAVEQSRQRISSTLDALEDRIVEKKHEIQDRVDVLRPVRDQVTRRPFAALAVGLGVGALLGAIGGSEPDRDEEEPASRKRHRSGQAGLSDSNRAEVRAWRRMRRDRLEARMRDRKHATDDGGSRMNSLRDQLMGAVTSAIGAAVTARVKDMTRGTGRRDHVDAR